MEEAVPLEGVAPAEQQFVQALINAINNANASIQQMIATMAAPQPPAAPAAGPFLRTPLGVGVATVLDYGSKDKQKLYKEATKSLFDTGSKFDVEPSNFQTFINLLHVRARDLGMLEPGRNMMVPPDPANPNVGVPINSIEDYGRTTMEQITAWESTFIAGNNRNSQNSKILHNMLMESLSVTGIQRIQVWKDQYSLNGLDSGGCLLKVIIRESYLDSNATVSTLRLNLSSLDTYIRDNGSDLVAFNAYVQSQLDGLSARGQTTNDLIVNLFKAYKVVPDQPFKQYITNIKDSHDDGTKIYTEHELMQKTVTFYKKALQEKEWEQPSEEQKNVLALQAEVKVLKKKAEKHVKIDKAAKKTSNHKVISSKKKGKQKGLTRPDWLENNTPPKDPKAMKFRFWNDVKWYWCAPASGGKCKGNWRRHSPNECKGLATKTTGTEKKTVAGNKRKAKALKIVTANSSLVEQTENEVVDQDELDEYQEESDYDE